MNEQELESQELLEESNTDERGDIRIPSDLRAVIAFTRDWTVDTMTSLLRDKNILLDPKFQRRNAWNDQKRSALIESLIWGAPVPQIILAELPDQPRKYVVIDGKQRLLAIWGYIDPKLEHWDKSQLRELRVLEELNGKAFSDLATFESNQQFDRRLLNADVRCTILSNYKSEDALAEIFYRINTGSVLLGAQELRQVLKRGWFADYLVEITNTRQPIHDVLGLTGPDVRLNDVEIILRCLAIKHFGTMYRGNLKQFLDSSMDRFTKDFNRQSMGREYELFNEGVGKLNKLLTLAEMGRKRKNGAFEKRFNRTLFEVQQFFISQLSNEIIKNFTEGLKAAIIDALENNVAFINSIESTTKSIERTTVRYNEFAEMVERVTGVTLINPFRG